MSSLFEDPRDKSDRTDWASGGEFKSIKSGSSMICPVRNDSSESMGLLTGDCAPGVVGTLDLPDIFRRISILFCLTTPGVPFDGRGGNPQIWRATVNIIRSFRRSGAFAT